MRKTKEQVAYLTQIYKRHGVHIGKKRSAEAVKTTGLRWKQISKWLLDKDRISRRRRAKETNKD